jgi:hypothetical protein
VKLAPKAGLPVAWVTHLTGLLSGEKQCRWATWVKARYWYTKRVDRTFDAAKWTADHQALLNRTRVEFEAETLPTLEPAWTLTVEDQNKFEFVGQRAGVSGKLDLVAVHRTEPVAVVVDTKSGKPRNEHYWQVLIYLLFAVPKLAGLAGRTVTGRVVYGPAQATHNLAVGPGDLTPDAKGKVYEVLRMVGQDAQPARVPSRMECQYCDIDECPERYVPPAPLLAAAVADTDEF